MKRNAMSRKSSKGMELPINAIVVLMILLVVAVVVIMWVSENFKKGEDSANLYKKRLELCKVYSESGCKLEKVPPVHMSFKNELTDTCTAMGFPMTGCASLDSSAFDDSCGRLCCDDMCSAVPE